MLQKALADAERKGIVQRNAARLADKSSTAQLESGRISWTPEKLRTLLAAAEGHDLLPLFWLTATTGMRRGEVCGLQWDDVDFDAMRLRSAGHSASCFEASAPHRDVERDLPVWHHREALAEVHDDLATAVP